MNNRILVVEDAIEIRLLLKTLLESEGYTVHEAVNGQEALDLLRSATELPAVILLDLMMPVMDGYQFREQQRRDIRLAQIPVVIMTADGHIELKRTKVEAVEAIKKPMRVDELLYVVEKFCTPPAH